MTGKIKTAFDCINAENSLKANTLSYLQGEIQKRSKRNKRVAVKRLAVCFASFAVIFFFGLFSYNLYFTASAYVDMDVNPSVALTINQFDRVIGVYAYNSDGEDILSGLELKHKKCEDALKMLIDTIEQKGYIQDEGIVSVTVQTRNGGKETTLLSSIKATVTDSVTQHLGAVQVDVFAVSEDTRNHSHHYNISPAKYLAILELMEIDPTVTVDSCKDHSIGEIKQITHEHTQNHHDIGNDVGYNGESDDDSDSHDQSGDTNRHHGQSGSENRNGHD